jgi:hypothetical protein
MACDAWRLRLQTRLVCSACTLELRAEHLTAVVTSQPTAGCTLFQRACAGSVRRTSAAGVSEPGQCEHGAPATYPDHRLPQHQPLT